MKVCGLNAATGQNEIAERLEAGFQFVDPTLHLLDMRGAGPFEAMLLGIGSCQLCPHRK